MFDPPPPTGEAGLPATPLLARLVPALPTHALPWHQLADCSGWVVSLETPPPLDLGEARPFPTPPVPIPRDPSATLAAAAAAALAYGHRRHVTDPAAVDTLLRREGPLAVIVPAEPDPSLRPLLAEVETLGVPLLVGTADLPTRLAALPAFAARGTSHRVDLGRPHDPALAAAPIAAVDGIGGDPLSSFVLHHEGEADGVRVTGQPSARLGIEVGVRGPGVGLAESARLEAAAAEYPGFLAGVSSHADDRGHGLRIEWETGAQPSPAAIGGAIRAWLLALDGIDLVDVRIVFAPPTGRSARLTDMRARAAAFKEYRTAVAAGDPPPAPG